MLKYLKKMNSSAFNWAWTHTVSSCGSWKNTYFSPGYLVKQQWSSVTEWRCNFHLLWNTRNKRIFALTISDINHFIIKCIQFHSFIAKNVVENGGNTDSHSLTCKLCNYCYWICCFTAKLMLSLSDSLFHCKIHRQLA